MRIAYLLLSSTLGMHQYTADLANRMAGSFEVQLVTTQKYPRDRYSPDLTVHTPVTFEDSGLSTDSLRIGQIGRIKLALEEARPDIVHFTGPHLWNMMLVRWLRRKRVKVVHTVHDMDPHHGVGYGRLLHVWNWAILRWADHIVVHGNVYRQRLIESGRDPSRVTCTLLTHLFVGYQSERELNESELAVEYEPIVLFFGRQEHYKGVDILLSAFERLKGSLAEDDPGQSTRLILAGPGNAYWERYDDRPDVEWRTHQIGDAEGIRLFRRCAVVVLPYRDATQSAVVAAAYFFRKPVIVTTAGALPEYVEPSVTGLVVDGENVEVSLCEAMKRMLRADGFKEALGAAGRAWYDEQRTRETEQIVRLYQGLINRNQAAG